MNDSLDPAGNSSAVDPPAIAVDADYILSVRPYARLIRGDCIAVLRALTAAGVRVKAVITDPPYHLESIVKRFGAAMAARAVDPEYDRVSRRFIGKNWDGGDVAFTSELWRAVHDILEPGGYVAAFSADRYYHRMASAMESGGLEPRHMLAWLYATGRMKAKDLRKMVAKRYGEAAAAEFEGWATDIKPALEPVALFRRPLAGNHVETARKYGTGGLNIIAAGVPLAVTDDDGRQVSIESADGTLSVAAAESEKRFPSNVFHDASAEVEAAFAVAGESGSSSPPKVGRFLGDFGTPSRFFFGARAGRGDRLESEHPTVKPIDAMRWLVRMLTPRGGLVLDMFAGTGTTGAACAAEGVGSIMIEREAEYIADIRARFAHIAGADLPLMTGTPPAA